MTFAHSHPVATLLSLGALLAGASAARAQEKPGPATEPAPAKTSAETDAAATAVETEREEETENPGSPRFLSAGGSERKQPDSAGLFPGGPMSVIVPEVKKFEKWMSENARLDLGFRLAWFFQQASAGPGERTAMAQDYRSYGTLHLFNWEPEEKGSAGNLYYRAEYRAEMFTKIPPAQLNTQIGTLFTTTYGQDEHAFALVQLYYEQFLCDSALRLRFGKLDPDDYFNLGRFADDYRYFDNTLFSAFPTSNHPSGGLGWNLQWAINPQWTFTTGMTDVQGRKTQAGFNTIDEGKFIYAADVTYSPKIEGLGQGNYRLGIEYRDAVEDKGRPSDTSFYFNIDQEIAKDVAPFLRYGHGTGRSTGISDHFSIGIGVDNPFNRLGDAFGWGIGFDTPDESVVSTRNVEWASEIFYRWQLTHAIQYTLGAQLIGDPINDPSTDIVGILEMRMVIDF